MCRLIAGSEGTLLFMTEIELQLDPLPPKFSAMIASHYPSINSCMLDVVPAMEHPLYTCEMMDKVILDCTKQNLKYRENRFFYTGRPGSDSHAGIARRFRSGTPEYGKPLAGDLEKNQDYLMRLRCYMPRRSKWLWIFGRRDLDC